MLKRLGFPLGYFWFSCQRLIGCTCLGSLLWFVFCFIDLLCFAPLICSVSVPVPDSFDYHCCAICLKVWNCDCFGFRLLFPIQGLLHFQMNFSIFSISERNIVGILIGITLNVWFLVICIFDMLILLIQAHDKFLNLLMSSSSFLIFCNFYNTGFYSLIRFILRYLQFSIVLMENEFTSFFFSAKKFVYTCAIDIWSFILSPATLVKLLWVLIVSWLSLLTFLCKETCCLEQR